jgi:short-subunit dehydrogenase
MFKIAYLHLAGWMASPGQNIYHATKHYVRAFSEALSVELRAYPGIVNTQLMPGPVHTQFITRAHAQEVFMMAASGAVEDPKAVATAGYNGLAKGKRMVFSSWNAAFTALMMQLAPRSVHLTLASLANAPLRGMARAKEPEKNQNKRGDKLEEKKSNEAN